MADEELAFETVARLASLIERREVSPVALVEAYLGRIDRLDDRLQAYITVCRESALAEGRTAEQEIASGRYRGPLHGVPIGLKDQFYTKGVRTTGGTRIHAGLVPDEDATIVRRLKDAGAIVLGKNNMAEFAMGGTRKHPYGNPRNPWDLERIPGHSSSGSGVAVSASMCAGAIGEDTGGSGRIPAAACGISAIRPTHGRISRHGTFPVSWSMDCASPMARTVEDCALLLETIAGHDPRDPTTSLLPVPHYASALRSDISDLRVGVVRELMPPESADAGVRAAFEGGVGVFENLAASVEEVSIPLIGLAAPIFVAICDTDGAHVHFDSIRERPHDYDSATRARLMSASLVSAGLYNVAQRARGLLRSQVMAALEGVDVLISPMSNGPPPTLAGEGSVFQSKEDVIARQFGSRSFTTPHSLAALPAMTVPCGFNSVGTPVGLHIAGRPFEEQTVLDAGFAFQSVTDWHERRPAL